MTPQDNLVGESGFTDGRLNPEGRAIAAVNALPAIPFQVRGMTVGDRVDVLETAWRTWCVEHPWLTKFCQPALAALREQVELLARAMANAIASEKATEIQGQFYQNYLQLADEKVTLRKFLAEHFPEEIAHAEATKRELPEVVKELLLRVK